MELQYDLSCSLAAWAGTYHFLLFRRRLHHLPVLDGLRKQATTVGILRSIKRRIAYELDETQRRNATHLLQEDR